MYQNGSARRFQTFVPNDVQNRNIRPDTSAIVSRTNAARRASATATTMRIPMRMYAPQR